MILVTNPRQRRLKTGALTLGLLTLLCWLPVVGAAAESTDEIRIGYLHEVRRLPPALSNLDTAPADAGLAGAKLGSADNNATGKFTGQRFKIEVQRIDSDANPLVAWNALLSAGIELIVLDVPADTLDLLLQQPLPPALLLFNVAAPERKFRSHACHPALLHTGLSRDMRTDALAQFLLKKRWKRWFLITGPRPADQQFADAIKRSARKFGTKIVAQKRWSGEFDARRSAQSEIPLFTQGPDYDVLLVADELGDFGNYLMFQTWDPRPVAGTQGLMAASWGRPLEQWGAAQLQERFLKQSARWMRPRDYAAWLAVRSIGEAALRRNTTNAADIGQYIRSSEFQLAGFKGRKLSFRPWNGQLRQPVPLLWAQALVALAPLDGYLHQFTELDTLGIDRAENSCRLP